MSTYQLSSDMHLSASEQATFYERIETLPPRERCFFVLLIETGARVSELLAVTRDDIDESTRSVLIRGIKGSRDRVLPVRPEAWEMLLSLGERPFPFSVRYAQLQWHKLMRIKYRRYKKPLHCLRHTFAVNLYLRTKDIKLVQAALGHVNIRNTMIYTEIDMSNELLTRVLPKAL